MDEINLNLPDTFEAADVGALVAAYAPELEPQPPGILGPLLSWLFATLVVGGVLVGPSVTESLPLFILILTASVAGAWVTGRVVHRSRISAYEETIAKRPYELHEKLAEKFREEIAAHRDRLLGDDTEWQHTRTEPRKATVEARGSLTYWTDRWLEDQRSELSLSHRNTACLLHDKLSGALTELNGREDALLTFFGQCEAKIGILDRSRSDHMESQRLAALSQHADDLIMDAALAIEALGRQFITRSIEVGQALGALERLQLKDSAGDIEHDGIERVAERILEAAQEEERVLSDLVATVSG